MLCSMTIGYPSVSLHSIPERKVDITMINGHIWWLQKSVNYNLSNSNLHFVISELNPTI